MARKMAARPDSDVLGSKYPLDLLECTIVPTDFQQGEYRPLVLGDAPTADNHGQADAVDKARLGLLDLGDTNAQVAAVGQELQPSRENARLVSQQAGLEGVESGSFCTTLAQDQHPKLKSNDNDFSSCVDQCSSPSMHPPWSLSLPSHDASTETSVVHLEKGDSQSGAYSNPLNVSEHESRDSRHGRGGLLGEMEACCRHFLSLVGLLGLNTCMFYSGEPYYERNSYKAREEPLIVEN
ncbi:hypothetical protein BJY01DRAFT_229503, partial [Aspergillus pseudoustus]